MAHIWALPMLVPLPGKTPPTSQLPATPQAVPTSALSSPRMRWSTVGHWVGIHLYPRGSPTSSACLCSSLDVSAGFLDDGPKSRAHLAIYNSAELQEHPSSPPVSPRPSRPSPTFQASSHLRAIVPDLPLFSILSSHSSRLTTQWVRPLKSLLNCYPYS